MPLKLGLEYEAQLPPVVRDELEQLIAALQVAFNNLASSWVDLPFLASNFRTGTAMVWTVTASDQVTFRYLLIGHTMIVSWRISATSVGGTLNTRLDLAIPGGYRAARLTDGVYHYIDNGTRGTGLCAVSAASGVIQLFKQDISNWAASTNNTQVQGVMIFEVE